MTLITGRVTACSEAFDKSGSALIQIMVYPVGGS